jgi:hypothetical protein
MQQQQATSPGLPPADILTPTELAARLKVRTTWVYEKLRQRDADPLPAFRCGRYLRFVWPQVSAWLLRQHARQPKLARKAKAA